MEEEKKKWRILEFYSGIGAMRYSLLRGGVDGHVVEAFDINDVANDVYQHNFAHRPFQGNIQTLTAGDLDKYGAHAWLLSPPCQPYTRQGLKKASADARAFSFIKILELMPKMLHPPLMLFVENVVGFETSDTHEQMMKVLYGIGFVTQEFILTPLQFGVPYSRPRYFCLGKKEPLLFRDSSFNNLLFRTPSPLMQPKDDLLETRLDKDSGCNDELAKQCEPIINFLDARLNINDEVSEEVEGGTGCSPIELFSVPASLIERWGSAMDIVYPESRRCCCFTKSYYRYVKGTGSLLATSEVIGSEKTEKSDLKQLGLRFFTPREIANLHSLPADFHFPPHITLRQQYALLGNSLSVAVVAPLLHYLFSVPT